MKFQIYMNDVFVIQGVLDVFETDIKIVEKKFSKIHLKLLSRSAEMNLYKKIRFYIVKFDHERS